MPNVLNQMMTEELTAMLSAISNCVVVDFQGLTVEEVNSLRSSLKKEGVSMRVIKTSLALRVLAEQEHSGYEELVKGPTAVIWGDIDIVSLTKAVHDFAKKNKTLKIKGGFLDHVAITKADVVKLTKVPEMPVLLGGIAAGIAAPVQSVYNCIDSMLTSILYAIDAVREKKEQE